MGSSLDSGSDLEMGSGLDSILGSGLDSDLIACFPCIVEYNSIEQHLFGFSLCEDIRKMMRMEEVRCIPLEAP